MSSEEFVVRAIANATAAQTVARVWALVDRWENATELTTGQPSVVAQAFAAEVRKALEGEA